MLQAFLTKDDCKGINLEHEVVLTRWRYSTKEGGVLLTPKRNLIVLLLMSVFVINTCYAVSVGDSYGGGTVFCVSKTEDLIKCETTGSGDYGLIMANEDQVNYDSNSNHGVTWSGEYKTTDAQSFYYGANNTKAVIKAHPKDDSSNNAAWLCYNYKDKIEGHTDWYLPSKSELNKMYFYAKINNLIGKNCTGSKVGGIQCFMGGRNEYMWYWSSDEYPYYNDYAWHQYFSGGYEGVSLKVSSHFAVRAIRSFNNSTIHTQRLNEKLSEYWQTNKLHDVKIIFLK